ncbi:MAG TPA: type II toxin-antitoxin system RelE/ParE family toxin [Sphingomicrobium sp.]|nr:type II toxin-antitoxin system RelE/ParE family toxin [Sphingomicrobium sp.]
MRRIIWSREATDNLEAIVTYISAVNPDAAVRIADRLVAVADSLTEFPERGRPGPEGTREMTIVPPYILRYSVDQDSVSILQIWHGARDLD